MLLPATEFSAGVPPGVFGLKRLTAECFPILFPAFRLLSRKKGYMTEDSRYNCRVNLTGNTVTAGGENSRMKRTGALVVPFRDKKRFCYLL